MGVSPTEAMPLSRAMGPSAHMHVIASTPSRFSVWRSLESRADRLASYGALALGLGVCFAFFLL